MNITLDTLNDIDELMQWRAEVLTEVFCTAPSDEVLKANRAFYERKSPDSPHLAMVAYADGVPAGCGNVCFYSEMPTPDNPSGRCAYLMNIYVKPQFRHNGIAHRLISRLVDVALDLRCGKIYLESTDNTKHLYTTLGFKPMPDMMKL